MIGSSGSDATGAIYASDDAGATWITTQNVGELLPAGTVLEPGMVSTYAGPFGYVAVIVTGKDHPEHTYLLNSSSGTEWKPPISVASALRRTATSRA